MPYKLFGLAMLIEMVGLVKDSAAETQVDQLVFIERDAGPVGAIGLFGALTAQSGHDAFIVRTKRLVKNSMIRPYNTISSGSHVLLVTDVVTGGGHLRNAVQALQSRLDQQEFHVVCYACREEKTIENLKAQGIIVHALYPPDEVQKRAEQKKKACHGV